VTRLPGITAPAFGALLLATAYPARSETPMSYLESFGLRGDHIATLTWALLILATVVVVIIGALVLVGVLRRPGPGAILPGTRLPVSRETGSALGWIYFGLVLTTVALAGSVVWTVIVMAAIDEPPDQPRVTIDITGHQWWWEVRYAANHSNLSFETANEIHVPVGEPVRIRLNSEDVIHSFWVPALSGKTDLIPGQTNVTWLQADVPGVYRGQCAEYCGEQHAHMVTRVFAQRRDAFDAWWAEQIEPAAEPDEAWLREAEDVFILRCGACHTVRGTRAGGEMGPDLTHLMSRSTIAAGMLPNTVGHLSGWIANPENLKPGTTMPNPHLTGTQLAAVRSYLLTLD
jgi:cytochrome c oxidase subunit II